MKRRLHEVQDSCRAKRWKALKSVTDPCALAEELLGSSVEDGPSTIADAENVGRTQEVKST